MTCQATRWFDVRSLLLLGGVLDHTILADQRIRNKWQRPTLAALHFANVVALASRKHGINYDDAHLGTSPSGTSLDQGRWSLNYFRTALLARVSTRRGAHHHRAPTCKAGAKLRFQCWRKGWTQIQELGRCADTKALSGCPDIPHGGDNCVQ